LSTGSGMLKKITWQHRSIDGKKQNIMTWTILLLVFVFVWGLCIGWVKARTHFTGIPPEEWVRTPDDSGSAADDGGPNFH